MSPRVRHASFHFLVLLLLAFPAGAAAQTVVGRVVDEATLEPLSAAFVVLQDRDGQRRAGVLTGPDGRFVLRAPAPGTYRLVTEMIGYAGATSEDVELAAGQTVERSIQVPVRAIALDGIQVAAGARCRARPGSGPETARLWDEARKALEVASWSETNASVQFQGLRSTRLLDPGSLRVVRQTETPWRGWSDRSPFLSIPAEELAQHGYVQAQDEEIVYYAPDAEVLLSDSFLDNHCFAVAEAPRGEPELVGLSFEPLRDGDVPGIRGVLWLDQGSAELRRLEFDYTRVPGLPSHTWDSARGRVEFERLSTGVWIVRRWWIRMPEVEMVPGQRPGADPRYRVAAVHETGAEVRAVRGADGRALSESTGATLYGVVTEEGSGLPVAGALVEVVAAGRTAATGEDGSYRFTDLPAGRFAVEVVHPDLDLAGVPPESAAVELAAGRASRLPVAVAVSAARADQICREHGWQTMRSSPHPVLLLGRVSDEAGDPAQEVMVHIAEAATGAPAAAGGMRVLTDSEGVYRLCLDPVDGEVRVWATPAEAILDAGAAESGITVTLADAGFVRADLALTRATTAVGGRAGDWQSALLGTVLDEDTKAGIGGAQVSLFDADGVLVRSAVSDATGRFRIAYPDRGDAYEVRVEHVAYGTATGAVRFERSEQLTLEVLLGTRAIPLEPVVVTERRHRSLAQSGFYDRRARGTGVFVEVDDARRLRTSRVTDLLVGQPAIRMVPAGPMGTDVDIRIAGTDQPDVSGERMLRECQPTVFLDGMLMRRGGVPNPQDHVLSDIINPDAVAGIEVFRRASEIPVQYRGSGAACGVVLIWTR